MIAQISGVVIKKGPDFAIIDVGGLGYKVYTTVSAQRLLKKDENASLYTHLSVRENALDLYGFSDEEELSIFEMLVSISGIGPKSARAILSITDAATLRGAVAQGDASTLTKVSGIGKKNAERIIIELRDKLGVLEENSAPIQEEVDAIEALKALGYSVKEARDALKRVSRDISGVDNRIKEALKVLGR
jgi:Holliday junction DNA helicase RuvA|tara:strand:- start:21651 stop:22217 length:567 start_codon:yes stop_codon:yes gene_type:complete